MGLTDHERRLVLVALAAGLTACGQPPESFSIVMLPDTLFYSERHPSFFHDQTKWIAANAETENIAFVTHVGDIVAHGDARPEQWRVAREAMERLNGVVPWGVAIGNHDYDLGDPPGRARAFLENFGPDRFRGRSWYGGASANGLNSCQLFRALGREYLAIHLETDAPDAAITWAQGVLDRFPGRPAIVTTHVYLSDETGKHAAESYYRKGSGNSGQQIWDKLVRRNPRIFLVLCGHSSRAGGEAHQISANDDGQVVYEILADYQKRDHGGSGWLRIIRFHPRENMIQVETFSPPLQRFERDPSSRFAFFVNFAERFGGSPAKPERAWLFPWQPARLIR